MKTTTAHHPQAFHAGNFRNICDTLATNDPDLNRVLAAHGYPPMWTRENSFETLVHIILEQQVSLASALASLNMLQKKTKTISPESILALSDEEMRGCYVSRQKTGYIRGLATAISSGEIQLAQFKDLPDEAVRARLIQLKGIGNWTIDIYLMFVLQRADIFPVGDLAAVNALKRLKGLSPASSKDDIVVLAQRWQPYRTVATMMLWHYYLSAMRKKVV